MRSRPNICTLRIKNLPHYVIWQQLKDIFKEFGTVLRADIAVDRVGKSLGYGVIVFEDVKEANSAIASLNGAWMNDREIRVEIDES